MKMTTMMTMLTIMMMSKMMVLARIVVLLASERSHVPVPVMAIMMMTASSPLLQ